ncbi:MAG TPA: hypothetical protein VGJ00_08315 [Rhabdochlamydiaceae bacterium]|jgi:nitrous oxidase accessory protein NosD
MKMGKRGIFKTGIMAIFLLAIIPAFTTEKTELATQSFPFFTTPEEYGAVGDGIQDDTVAMNAALASLAPGERLLLTGKYLINSANVLIPSNVTLEGTFEAIGTKRGNLTAPYEQLNSAIILNSSYTINLKGGSTIKGILIRRQGQLFPAADATGFAGTAITVDGDDASIIGCMILGFNLGIYSSGYQRQYFNHILGDNLNFIEVTRSYDIGRIVDCHAWPFVTIAYTGPDRPSDWAHRNIGYYLHDGADWFKMTNCFAMAYFRGILLQNSNSATLLGCGVDGTNRLPNAIGISIGNNCTEVRLNACQIAGQAHGVFVNTSAENSITQIVNCNFWGNRANEANSTDVYIGDGDVEITGGCRFRDTSYAVYVNNPASHVLIEGNAFYGFTQSPIFNQANSPYIQVGLNYYGNFPTGSSVVANMALPSATVGSGAQSNALLLPSSGDVFFIPAGTGNFSFINGSFDGRVKTLIFNGALTITSSTQPLGVRLTNGANLTTSAGSSLSIIFTPAGYWVETGRCK